MLQFARRLLLVLAAVALAGCARFATYESVAPGPHTAQVRFMSAGGNVREVKALPASKPCAQYIDNLKILYRDSSNPLLPSANLDGVRVRAGEPLNFETLSMSIEPGESAIYARTHVMCSVPGSFIPEGGAVYVLSFTLDTVASKCSARLEQVEPVRQMVHLSNATRCAP